MRTAKQIVDQTNEMARIMYDVLYGCSVPKGTEFHTETINRHPHETNCWEAACKIQLETTETDVEDALEELM